MTTHITFTYTDYTGFRVLFVVCGNERSVFSEQTSFTVWDTSGSIMHKGGELGYCNGHCIWDLSS